MMRSTLFCSLIFLITLSFALPFVHDKKPQCNSGFSDTLNEIVTDSFKHDMGNLPPVNINLEKKFKYIGDSTVLITNTWTGDPHFICEWPKEPLIKGKEYKIKICFWFQGRVGRFNKVMGFTLTNGKRITFEFKGNVVPAKTEDPVGPMKQN